MTEPQAPDLDPVTLAYWDALAHLADHGTHEEFYQFATETAAQLSPEQTAAIVGATVLTMRDLLRTLQARSN